VASAAAGGPQDGGARVVEFREMVGALHDLGRSEGGSIPEPTGEREPAL